MICKSCGNEIPAGSVFCMYCGERQVRAPRKKGEIKIPKAVQLPSGKWHVQLRAEGQSKTFGTEEEANAWAKAVRAGFIEEKKKAPYGLTLRNAIDRYTDSKSAILSPSTLRGYKSIKNNRFPAVMDKPLRSVSSWQAVFNAEAPMCSAKTLKNAYELLHPALEYEGIDISDVDLPRVVKKERPWLTPEQIKVFIPALKGTNCEMGALLALHGLRRSEIFGLDWTSVDLDSMTFAVEASTVYNADNMLVDKSTTKSTSSNRVVHILIPRLAELLRDTEIKKGKVCTGNINHLFRQINRVCEKNGLPLVGVHGLRHSFASLGYHLKISEEEIMRMGGWSNYAIIHATYLHLSDLDKKTSVKKMERFFKNTHAFAHEVKKPSV